MRTWHAGMKIDEADGSALIGHLNGTLEKFDVPSLERALAVGFVQSTKPDIVGV
jgi:hypothetical protein